MDIPQFIYNRKKSRIQQQGLVKSIDYRRNTCPHRAFYDADNFQQVLFSTE